jgi:hypothetical protein
MGANGNDKQRLKRKNMNEGYNAPLKLRQQEDEAKLKEALNVDLSNVSKCDHPPEDRHGSGYLEVQYCMKCGKML